MLVNNRIMANNSGNNGNRFSDSSQRPHGFVLPRQNGSSIVADFFSNNEAPESNKIIRLAFDRAQVLKWVLRNNCNLILFGFLSPFLDNFDYPKICPFFEVVER